MSWGEPLYRNETMPSLERVDRVLAGGYEQEYWESPGTQGYSYTSVGQSQYDRPVVSGTSLGVPPVGG